MEQKISLNSSKNKLLLPQKNIDSSPSRTKLLAPSLLNGSGLSSSRWLLSIFRHPLMELESEEDYDFVSLFSPQMKQQLARLLQEVQEGRENMKDFSISVKTRAKLRNKGWLSSIQQYLFLEDAEFDSKDERELYLDKQQAEDHLSFVSSKITQCFGIPLPADLNPRTASNPTGSINVSHERHVSFKHIDPETPINFLRHRANKHLSSTPKPDIDRSPMISQNTSLPCALERSQLIGKLARSDNHFEGNPDYQPVRSFEVELLVVFLLKLSETINEHYSARIQQLYTEDSISGWLARFFICPPTEYVKVQRSTNSLKSERVVKNLPARVNLRFMAQRRVIFMFLFVLILLYIYL